MGGRQPLDGRFPRGRGPRVDCNILRHIPTLHQEEHESIDILSTMQYQGVRWYPIEVGTGRARYPV